MKRRILVLIMTMATGAALCAGNQHDVGKLYDEIDAAIKESPVYIATYENKINAVKHSWQQETDNAKKLVLGLQLFDMYKAFNNDSALAYIEQSIALARQEGRAELAAEGMVRMAFQCSTAGLYTEARELLEQTDKKALTRDGLGQYYFTYMHLYGEIACYTHMDEVRNRYFRMQEIYRDSALQYLHPGSNDYMMVRQMMLVNHGNLEEALRLNDQWQNNVMEGSHEHAIAAYYRHIIYDKMGNQKEAEYWLAKSALADIRDATMDQASLITLSDMLNWQGELDRSYQYIRFTWECNDRFNTRMRYWQLSPILTVIEKNYEDASKRNMRVIMQSIGGGLILLLLLVVLLVRNQRHKRNLLRTQQELIGANEQLQLANEKLQILNDMVTRYNRDLAERNKQLQEDKPTIINNENTSQDNEKTPDSPGAGRPDSERSDESRVA